MIERIDTWVGKRLFVPLAIRICQRFNITQHALHTYLWIVVWLSFIYDGPSGIANGSPGWFSWTLYIIIVIFAALYISAAALRLFNSSSVRWIRMLWLLLFVNDLLAITILVAAGESVGQMIYYAIRHWTILLAEYAATITTIPPLEEKQHEPARKAVTENG